MKHVERSSTEGVKVLRDMWLPECCAIVDMRRDQVESWMPQDDEVGTSVLFFFLYSDLKILGLFFLKAPNYLS